MTASASHHHAAVELLARVGSWRWDVSRSLYSCSDEMYRVFGFQPGEIEPTLDAFLERVHPDDRPGMLEEMQAVRRLGRFTTEYRIILPTGKERWIEASVEAIQGPDGTLGEVLGVAQDVTDRKERETPFHDGTRRKLMRSQRDAHEALTWLETLEDAAPIGLGRIDREFRYIRVNEQLAAVNGVPVEQHVGRRVADVVPDVWPQIEPVYRRVLDTGQLVVDQEITGETSAEPGRLRSWLVSYYPVRIELEIIGIGVILLDVTEQREAERHRVLIQDRLAESEARFRGLFTHAPMAMYVLDRSTLAFLEVNEASLERYGYTRDGFLAMGLMDISQPGEISKVRESMSEPNPDMHNVGRFHHLAKDGTRFSIEAYIRDIRFGEVDATLVIPIDVSEVERTEAALQTAVVREREAADRERELSQLKAQLLTSVSHELRTPLTNIVGMTKTIKHFGDAISAPDRADLIERLEENASHLDRLIADLIDLDRLTRGTFEPRCKEGILPVLTQRVVDRIDLGARNLLLAVDPVTVWIDHSFFDHILEELLGNVVRYTPADAPVSVEVNASGDVVEISVVDWGPGVPDDSKESIFESFRHAGFISHSPGQGIGLALVRQLAIAHGGKAWVTNSSGRGATFHVTLRQEPLLTEEMAGPADASTLPR